MVPCNADPLTEHAYHYDNCDGVGISCGAYIAEVPSRTLEDCRSKCDNSVRHRQDTLLWHGTPDVKWHLLLETIPYGVSFMTL